MADKKIDMTDTVWIESNQGGTIGFYGENNKMIILNDKGQVARVTIADLTILESQSRSMLKEGKIYIKDENVREYFNLDYSGIIHHSKINEVLDKPVEELEEILDKAPKAIKDEVAEVAKTKEIDSKKKTKTIEKKTGKKIEKDEVDKELEEEKNKKDKK